MKLFFSKKITKTSFLILLILFLVITFTHFAHAEDLSANTPGAMNLLTGDIASLAAYVVRIILYVFDLIVRLLNGLAAAWLGFVLNITLDPAAFQAGIIDVGFRICLQIADIFFLLIMVVIGLATILGIESYNLKKLLPRVIIIALFINFSLPIGQFIIGFTNDLAVFFFKQGFVTPLSGIGSGILTGIVQAQKAELFPSTQQFIQGSFFYQLPHIYALVISIIVNLLSLAALIIATFLFIARMAALWTLLIIAPLSWFGYVLPSTQKHWSEWWTKFFNWSFFAPIYALVLYITARIAQSDALVNMMNSHLDASFNSLLTGNIMDFFKNSIQANVGFLVYLMIVFSLLFGGLFASLKLAGSAGDKVTSWAKSGQKAIMGYTGKAFKQRVAAPALAGAGQGISRVPGLRTVGTGMMLKSAEYKAQQRSEFEKKYANLDKLSPEQQSQLVKNTLSNPVASGIEKSIALSKLRETNSKAFAELAQKDPSVKALIRDYGTNKDKMEAVKATGDAGFSLSADKMRDQNEVVTTLNKAFASMSPEDMRRADFSKILQSEHLQEKAGDSNETKAIKAASRRTIANTTLSQMNADTVAYMGAANPGSLQELINNSGAPQEAGLRGRYFRTHMRNDAVKYVVNNPDLLKQNMFNVNPRHMEETEGEYVKRRNKILQERKQRLKERQERTRRNASLREEELKRQEEERERLAQQSTAPRSSSIPPIDAGI